MAKFLSENLDHDGCDPNFVYRYKVGYGPSAVRKWYRARLKFGTRAAIEHDDAEEKIVIRSCNMNLLKEIVESL